MGLNPGAEAGLLASACDSILFTAFAPWDSPGHQGKAPLARRTCLVARRWLGLTFSAPDGNRLALCAVAPEFPLQRTWVVGLGSWEGASAPVREQASIIATGEPGASAPGCGNKPTFAPFCEKPRADARGSPGHKCASPGEPGASDPGGRQGRRDPVVFASTTGYWTGKPSACF